MQQTPSTQLAEVLLGEPLGDWVRRHRADDRSWPWISERLGQVTEGKVALSRTWLWRLYGDDQPAKRPLGSAPAHLDTDPPASCSCSWAENHTTGCWDLQRRDTNCAVHGDGQAVVSSSVGAA